MALPTLLKTWRFVPNVLVSEVDDLTMRAELMFQIKRRLTGNSAGDWTTPPSAFWVVVSSSDSVTADATDRWLDNGDLVWAAEASPHSWILLRRVDYFGVGDHLEWLISLNGTSRNGGIGSFMTRNNGGTFTGFSGGTTTARPSSLQEVQLRPDNGATASVSGWMGLDSATPTTRRFHVLASSDGQEWRVLFCTGGNCVALWSFGQLVEPPALDDTGVAGWDFPVAALVYALDSDAELLTVSNFNDTSGDSHYAIGELNTPSTHLAHVGTLALTTDEFVIRMVANNSFDGSVPFTSQPLILDTDQVRSGLMGYVKDQWWGLQLNNTADDYPDDASRQFVQASSWIFPWIGDGTVFNATA